MEVGNVSILLAEDHPTNQRVVELMLDGVADVVWTLPGYTAGRFPKSEVFELPFMAASAEATAQATQEFYEKHLKK